SRRRHTRFSRDWSSDVCSSDLELSIVAKKFLANSLTVLANLKKCPNKGSLCDFMTLIFAKIISHALNAYATSFSSRRSFLFLIRSEERRVGKECRSGWSA